MRINGGGGSGGGKGGTGYTGYTGPGVGATGATGFTGYTGPLGTGYTGYTGYTGAGNFTGYTGYSGYTGTTGYSGYTGYTGAGAFTGYTGYTGNTGYTGYTGQAGAGTGYTGYTGTTGYTGYTGAPGTATGYTGYTGYTGPAGVGSTGYTGYTGYTGIQFTWRGAWSSGITYAINDLVQYLGSSYLSLQNSNTNNTPALGGTAFWDLVAEIGYTGYTGYTGAAGAGTGYTGYTGYTGTTGYTGYTGSTGYTGYTGRTGYTGYTGYTGPQGLATGYTGYTGSGGGSSNPSISGIALQYNSTTVLRVLAGTAVINSTNVSFSQTDYTSASTMKDISNATVTLGASAKYWVFLSSGGVIGIQKNTGSGDGATPVFDTTLDYWKAASTGAAWRRIGEFWTDGSNNIIKFNFANYGRERYMMVQDFAQVLPVSGVTGINSYVSITITPYITADLVEFGNFVEMTPTGSTSVGVICDLSLDGGTSIVSRRAQMTVVVISGVFGATVEWLPYSSTFHYSAGTNSVVYIGLTGSRFYV